MLGWAPSSAVGLVGHSLGGWTVIKTADSEARAQSVVALVPAGSESPRPGVIDAPLHPQRNVPTLFIAAEDDVPIPPHDVRDVFARTPGATTLVTMRRTDHYHFVEDAADLHEQVRASCLVGATAWMPSAMKPIAELAAPEDTQSVVRALVLAHFDATVRANPNAHAFLGGDISAACAAQGAAVDVEASPTR